MDKDKNLPEMPEAQKQLLKCRMELSQVWDMIVQSDLCPSDFHLHNTCAIDGEFDDDADHKNHLEVCKECWEKAINTISDHSIKVASGLYFCAKCNVPLLFDKVTNDDIIMQHWHCPKCKKKFILSNSDGKYIFCEEKPKEEKKPAEEKPVPDDTEPDGEEPNDEG